MSNVQIVDTIGAKKTRLFASFRDKNELDERLKTLFDKIPKKYKSELWLFLGQLESTLVEGYTNE